MWREQENATTIWRIVLIDCSRVKVWNKSLCVVCERDKAHCFVIDVNGGLMTEGRGKSNELLMDVRQQIKPIDVINLYSNYRAYLYRRRIYFSTSVVSLWWYSNFLLPHLIMNLFIAITISQDDNREKARKTFSLCRRKWLASSSEE